MIPGLEHAEFARYGVMHRNTFLDAPRLLDSHLRLTTPAAAALPAPVYVAGQVSGTEGYCEAMRSGLHAALAVAADLRGVPLPELPRQTAFGALLAWACNPATADYQPMHVNFGIMEPLRPAGAQQARSAYAAAYAARGPAAPTAAAFAGGASCRNARRAAGAAGAASAWGPVPPRRPRPARGRPAPHARGPKRARSRARPSRLPRCAQGMQPPRLRSLRPPKRPQTAATRRGGARGGVLRRPARRAQRVGPHRARLPHRPRGLRPLGAPRLASTR